MGTSKVRIGEVSDLLVSGKKKGSQKNDKNPWEKDLENYDLTKDTEFRCFIGIFIESTSLYYGIMEMFNEEALKGKRWEIKVISIDYIRNTVLDSCTKSRDKKPFNLLCDQILRYAGYEFKGRIPPKLLAYFIKYEIRKLKAMYKEYLDYQKECEDGKAEKHKSLSSLERSKQYDEYSVASKRQPDIQKLVSQIKPQLTKTAMERRRAESNLTRRGEEKRGKFYVQDNPIEGPQVYMVITTVYEQLPAQLIEVLQIPVTCIIKVGEDQIYNMNNLSGEKINLENNEKLLQINSHYYEKKSYRKKCIFQDEHMKKTNDIQQFWLNFNKNIQNPESSHYYGWTILGRYKPPINKIDFSSDDWQEKLKITLYEDITQTLYNLYQIIELYKEYSSSEGINIKKPAEATGNYSLNVYNMLLDQLPTEYVNVPTIFEALQKQVEDTILKEHEAVRESMMSEIDIKMSSTRETILLQKLFQLNYQNDITKDETEDSKRIYFKKITDHLKDQLEITCAHKGAYPKSQTEKCQVLGIKYSLQFSDIEPLQDTTKKHLNTFKKVLGIRKRKMTELLLVLKTIDKIQNLGHMLKSDLRNQSFFCDEIEDQLYTPSERKAINKLDTIEEYKPEVLLRILFELSIKQNTSERVYIPLLDSFLYSFYNCPKNCARSVAMQTPLGLKDFFKYVLPKEQEWAQFVLTKKRDNSYTVMHQLQLEEIEKETSDKLKANEKAFSSENASKNRNNEDVIHFLYEMDYPDTFLTTDKKTKTWSFFEGDIETLPEVLRFDAKLKDIDFKCKEIQQKELYDFGRAQRVQYARRDVEALFRSDTKLRIQYRHKHYGRKSMNLELEFCGHRLYYSSNVHINTEITKVLLVHQSGMIFNLKEYQRRIVKLKTLDEDKRDSNMSPTREKEKNDSNKSPPREKEENIKGKSSKNMPKHLVSYYTLTMTLPLSYTIEVKRLTNEDSIYIKYVHLETPSSKYILNELFRIFIAKNCITKFLTNGDQELLFSSGKKIVIPMWEWHHIFKGDEILLKVQNYKINDSCGRISSMRKDGEEVKEGNMQMEETVYFTDKYRLIELQNETTIKFNFDGSQVVEFSDKTKFKTDIICKTQCLQNLFSAATVDPEKIDHTTSVTTDKSDIAEEEYEVIYQTITVEHPNFATTIYREEDGSIEIKLPWDTSVLVFFNGAITIKMSEGSALLAKPEYISIEKYLKRSLFQQSIIFPNVLKYNCIPRPPLIHFLTRDVYGNELNINTQSEIHYEYSLSQQHAFCLKYMLNNRRYFLIRRDLSGFEVIPQHILSSLKNKINSTNQFYIEHHWENPFLNTTMLIPAKKENSLDSTVESKLPSTYGDSHFYPFRLIKATHSLSAKTLACLSTKTLMCKDIAKKYDDTAIMCRKFLNKQAKILKCKCKRMKEEKINLSISKEKKKPKKEHIVIKKPGTEFIGFLKEFILYKSFKKAFNNLTRNERLNKFKTKRNEVLQKKIPKYFESPFGIAYFIVKEINIELYKTVELNELKE